MSRIRVDNRYSAALTYRAYQPIWGSKVAYLIAVVRYGWPNHSNQAHRILWDMGFSMSRMSWSVLERISLNAAHGG